MRYKKRVISFLALFHLGKTYEKHRYCRWGSRWFRAGDLFRKQIGS